MTEKLKKIDKDYVLSDSSVNEYGFRLLTPGYQIEQFQKNPIGYYMHRREDGVVLKWDDLRMEDDQIIGRPVINLSNERGIQTYDEAENGFLNAASVGHIVVLEYSNDPELMLPGQTGPTITKWYHKECSLVDIPGNCNALTKLYDEQENEINLMDLNGGGIKKAAINNELRSDLAQLLHIGDNTEDGILISTVKNLALQAAKQEKELALLLHDKDALQQQLDELHASHRSYEINALLDKALEDKRITKELKDKLAVDYATNAEGLKLLLKAMPAYRSIVDTIKNREREKAELQWSWDEFEAKDPSGQKLKELKANYPDRYQELFKEKFEVVS